MNKFLRLIPMGALCVFFFVLIQGCSPKAIRVSNESNFESQDFLVSPSPCNSLKNIEGGYYVEQKQGTEEVPNILISNVPKEKQRTIHFKEKLNSIKEEKYENRVVNDINDTEKSKTTLGGKKQIVALILCIVLGLIGVHRFYLGYTGTGILYLLTLGLLGIGWLIDVILLIIPNGLSPKGRTSYKE